MNSTLLQRVEDPSICIVHHGKSQRIGGRLAELLNPVEPRSFHQYRLPARTDVELHYHEYDEYWWFVQGRPRVTLRGTTGVVKTFDLEPGDMVACVRGVEHTLWADHELVYYQYSSVLVGGESMGHLRREEPAPPVATPGQKA